jgi:hypothetical protein
MKLIYINECAVDGCFKKSIGKGFQMCEKHQDAYEKGKKLKAFSGKTVQKKEFQTEAVK